MASQNVINATGKSKASKKERFLCTCFCACACGLKADVRRDSTLLTVREMQIEPSTRNHLTPVGMAKPQIICNSKYW